ncbi:MAG TPA: D-amino-acid transaminase [Stellaceae bacterium]|nr:D-amino-acid transaminase [Stellaceae bacterium]
MSRIAYVSGRFVPQREAVVPIEDRGYQFADGVYEVAAVHRGRLIDLRPHLDRLARSLRELDIVAPVTERVLIHILERIVRLNRIAEGSVYLQITRGVAPRDHAFPTRARPQLVVTAKRSRRPDPAVWETGIRVITIPEQRWARRDVKSVSLLPNVLGKQRAREAGAYEAWQVDPDGTVTEGTSSNAWIVNRDGELVTPPPSPRILNGVTRLVLLGLARRAGLTVVERHFSLAEALEAREALLSSTTSMVLPVTQIDDRVIANGRPGEIATTLRDLLAAHFDAPRA